MADVDGIACDFVKGRPPGLKERVDTWQTPGNNGYGALLLGKGNAEFRYLAVKYGSNAAVNSWIDSIEAVQGKSVSITDDVGDTFADQFIIRVNQANKKPVVRAGTAEYRAAIVLQGVKVK